MKILEIDYEILGVLLERELYALEILDQLNLDRSSDKLRFGSIYSSINRLEKQKLVSWRWGEPFNKLNGVRCKYYGITDLGKKIVHMKKTIKIEAV